MAEIAAIDIDHIDAPSPRIGHGAPVIGACGEAGKDNLFTVVRDIGGIDIDQVERSRGWVATIDQRTDAAIAFAHEQLARCRHLKAAKGANAGQPFGHIPIDSAHSGDLA